MCYTTFKTKIRYFYIFIVKINFDYKKLSFKNFEN